ncbi:MAG: glycosyltransferase family 4 protein [Bacilli bacterium]|nr:glycosyltransferase family 4 protein [Bacilli bacterium]
MNICFLCQFFYPSNLSSARLPYETALSFKKNGHNVSCITEALSNDSKIEEDVFGIKVFHIQKKYNDHTFWGRIKNFISFSFNVYKKLKKMNSVDIVFVYSNPPILPLVASVLKKKKRFKIIFVSYDVYPEIAIATKQIKKASIYTLFMKICNKIIFSKIDKVVAISNEMKNFISSKRSFNKENILVIPNWGEKIEKCYPSFNNFCISYVGNLGICQDIDSLLRLIYYFGDKKGFVFNIAGQGKKYKKIKDTIESNKYSNIFLYPFVSGDQLQSIMSSSNCYLITLCSNLNGLCFPSKLYTYAAYGRPIIFVGDNVDVSNEIHNNGLGKAFKSNEICSCITYIEEMSLVSSDKQKESIDNLYKNNCVIYNKEQCLQKYIELVENIAK